MRVRRAIRKNTFLLLVRRYGRPLVGAVVLHGQYYYRRHGYIKCHAAKLSILIFAAFIADQADGCTSGFPSLDRIYSIMTDEYIQFSSESIQVLVPSINFTCSGSILSWVFGWVRTSDSFIELQIWRPVNGEGDYIKVGGTTINETVTIGSLVYQYSLTSPLSFQAGDVLGYFRSESHVLFQGFGSELPLYSIEPDSPAPRFSLHNASVTDGLHALIGATIGN